MPTTKNTEPVTALSVETPKKKKLVAKKASTPRKRVKPQIDASVAASAPPTRPAAKEERFIAAVGRRKTAVARVRLTENGEGRIIVNGKKFEDYFTTYDLRQQVILPLKVTGQETTLDASIKVAGGGIRGQAEAVRHGISRVLIQLNPIFRKSLKKLGFLTRDARKRERKKFGLKSARRAPQWSKR